MSAIIEPEGASWWGSDRWGEKGRITFTANTEDRSVFIRRQYPSQDLQESIELDLGQLAEVEAMLLNARLWLERATKQADELKAAEEVEQGDHCARCDHPFHHGRRCDSCGCRVCHNCWQDHPRAGGEHLWGNVATLTVGGSSPRWRGAHFLTRHFSFPTSQMHSLWLGR